MENPAIAAVAARTVDLSTATVANIAASPGSTVFDIADAHGGPFIASTGSPIVAPSPGSSATASGPDAPSAGSFSTLVSNGLQQVNTQLMLAQSGLQELAVGDAASLHRLMAALEESRIGFQLLLQVRNRLLESYQEVMRMQL